VICNIETLKRSGVLFGLAAFLCAIPTSANAQCGTTPATGAIAWTTNWCDEFNGALNSQIDPTNWTYDTGSSGFGNNELEDYCAPTDNTAPCSSSSPNAFIDGSGHLAIQVRGPANSDCTPVGTCTSARLNTSGKQSFHSGRIEARLQIPSHVGLWPAFWNLGSQPGVSWPTVGESDIMENWPTTSNIAGPGATGNCSTIHTQVTAGNGKGHCFTLPTGQIDTAFHVYSANPFFLLMNVAIGGTLGNPTDTTTSNPPPLLVDYVRQYLPSAISPPQLTPNGDITIKAGATTGNTTSVDLLGTVGTGRVTFSCSTNAPKSSCVVTSSDAVNNHTIDFAALGTATATVSVATTANTAVANAAPFNWMGFTGAGLLAVVLIPVRKKIPGLRLCVLLVAIPAIGMMPSCGGGSSTNIGPPPPPNGTTPGHYTVTVNTYTMSSSDAANPSSSATFNLTVN
jgi:beta-glucanase (GH16 family)